MNMFSKERSIFLHGNRFAKFWERYYENHKFRDDEQVNFYVDFPYCVSNCDYCMYKPANYGTHKDEIEIYESELLKLIDSCKHLFGKRQIGMVSFGGGTASLMSRDCVREIVKMFGDSWNKALARKMEVHPKDLSEDYIDFLINEVNITNISIGVQSFNIEANKGQHRISINLDELIHYIDILHKAGVYTNIDLVALFNGETEKDWEIFRDDLRIVRECIKPSMLFTQVNYATQDHYYEHTLRLRKELIEFVKLAPEYAFGDERYWKLDMEDVQRYQDSTYFLSHSDYLRYLTVNKLFSNDIGYGNYIGFGGNTSHKVFSLTQEGDKIYSFFDFFKKRWVHEQLPRDEYYSIGSGDNVKPTADNSKDLCNNNSEEGSSSNDCGCMKEDSEIIPVIQVGPYFIREFDPSNSIYDEEGKIKCQENM